MDRTPNRHHAIIVEPSRAVRRLISEAVRQCGIQVVEADSGRRAIELFETLKPQLVITAQVLPDIVGLELCAALKASDIHRTLVVMVTAEPERFRVPATLGPDLLLPKKQEDLLSGLYDFITFVGLRGPIAACDSPHELRGSVLVADDDRLNQMIVRHALQDSGVSVTTVSDGREAVRRVALHRFELLIFDIEMPAVDGWRAIHRIRDSGVETPAIALTGHRDHHLPQRTRDAGFDRVIAKPVDREELLARCRGFLR